MAHGFAAAAAAVLLTTGSVAVAQQSAPSSAMPGGASSSLQQSTLVEVKDNNAMAPSLNVNRKDLAGMTIYGSDGKKISGVDKVLGDSSNSIKAVTADVGGFLGIGSHEVIIPIEKLSKGDQKDSLKVSMTNDELKNLPQYASSNNRSSGSVGGSPANNRAPSGGATSPQQNR
ncbi:MAG: PRC-barrel domain-containing protein [Gemmatimonas sp.]